MKRIKNSVKVLIASICVAVIAVGAVVGIIIAHNLKNKNKGGQEVPETPQIVYELTEDQKSLVEAINNNANNVANAVTPIEVDQYFLDNNNVYTVSEYTENYVIAKNNFNEDLVYVKNADGEWVDIADYIVELGLVRDDYSNFSILTQTSGYILYNGAYTVAVEDQFEYYNDLGVIRYGDGEPEIVKSYINSYDESGVINSCTICDGMFLAELNISYTISETTYELNYDDISFYLLDSDDFSEPDFVFEPDENKTFDMSTLGDRNPMQISYTDGTKNYIFCFDGKFIEQTCSAYEKIKMINLGNTIMLEIETRGASLDDKNPVFVESYDASYYATYSYKILKTQEDGSLVFEDYELEDGYAKLEYLDSYSTSSDEDFYLVVYRQIDENHSIKTGGLYVYFDSDLNRVMQYVSQENSKVLYSNGKKIVLEDGIYGAKKDLTLIKLVPFALNGERFYLQSSSISSEYLIVVDAMSQKNYNIMNFDCELLFEDGIDSYDVIGNGIFVIYIDDETYIFDAKTKTKTLTTLPQDEENYEFLQKTKYYFVEREDHKYDLVNFYTNAILETNITSYNYDNGLLTLVIGEQTKVLSFENTFSLESHVFQDVENSGVIFNWEVEWTTTRRVTISASTSRHFTGGAYPASGSITLNRFHGSTTISFRTKIQNGNIIVASDDYWKTDNGDVYDIDYPGDNYVKWWGTKHCYVSTNCSVWMSTNQDINFSIRGSNSFKYYCFQLYWGHPYLFGWAYDPTGQYVGDWYSGNLNINSSSFSQPSFSYNYITTNYYFRYLKSNVEYTPENAGDYRNYDTTSSYSHYSGYPWYGTSLYSKYNIPKVLGGVGIGYSAFNSTDFYSPITSYTYGNTNLTGDSSYTLGSTTVKVSLRDDDIYASNKINYARYVWCVYKPAIVNVRFYLNAPNTSSYISDPNVQKAINDDKTLQTNIDKNEIDKISGNYAIKLSGGNVSSLALSGDNFKSTDCYRVPFSNTLTITNPTSTHYKIKYWIIQNSTRKRGDTDPVNKEYEPFEQNSGNQYTRLRNGDVKDEKNGNDVYVEGEVTFIAVWTQKEYAIALNCYNYGTESDSKSVLVVDKDEDGIYKLDSDFQNLTATGATDAKITIGGVELTGNALSGGDSVGIIYESTLKYSDATNGIVTKLGSVYTLPTLFVVSNSSYQFFGWAYRKKNPSSNPLDRTTSYVLITNRYDDPETPDDDPKDVFGNYTDDDANFPEWNSYVSSPGEINLYAVYIKRPYYAYFSAVETGGSNLDGFGDGSDTWDSANKASATSKSDNIPNSSNLINLQTSEISYKYFFQRTLPSNLDSLSISSLFSEPANYFTDVDNELAAYNSDDICLGVKINTNEYRFSKIVLHDFGYYDGTNFSAKEIVIKYSGSSWSCTQKSGGSGVSGSPWTFGSKYNEVYFNKVEIQKNSEAEIILIIRNVGLPGGYGVSGNRIYSKKDASDTFKLNSDTIVSSTSGIRIEVFAESNYINPDTLKITTENIGDTGETAFEFSSQKLIKDQNEYYFWLNSKKYYLGQNLSVSGFYKVYANSGNNSSSTSSSTSLTLDKFVDISTNNFTSSNVIIVYVNYIDNNTAYAYYPSCYVNKSSTSSNSATSSRYYVNAVDNYLSQNYMNTRVMVVEPAMNKSYQTSYADDDPTTTDYYELKDYISKITIGTNVFTMSVSRSISKTSSAWEYSNFSIYLKQGSTIISSVSNAIGQTIKYFDKDYIILDAYKINPESQNYILYFARNSSNGKFLYFIYTNATKTRTINFEFKNLNQTLTLSASSDGYYSGSTPNEKKQTLLVRRAQDNGDFGTSFTSAATTTFDTDNVGNSIYYAYPNNQVNDTTYNMTFRYYPYNMNRLVLQANDGYLIKSVEFKIKNKVNNVLVEETLFKFEIQSASFNNLTREANGNYTYTVYSSENNRSVSLLEYKSVPNNIFKAYAPTSGKFFGCYYSYMSGYVFDSGNASRTGTYNFNSLYLMIGGIYTDCDLIVNTTPYTDLIFENGTELFDSVPAPNTGIKDINLNSVSKLSLYNTVNSTGQTYDYTKLTSASYVKYYHTITNGIPQGTVRIIFIGDKVGSMSGLAFVASGENYSRYFTNGRYYYDCGYTYNSSHSVKDSLGMTLNSFRRLDNYSGRHKDTYDNNVRTEVGGYVDNKELLLSTDYLTFMQINNFRTFFNYQARSNTANNNVEKNRKYMFITSIGENNVTVTTNSYLFNSNLSLAGTYTYYYDFITYTGTTEDPYSWNYSIINSNSSANVRYSYAVSDNINSIKIGYDSPSYYQIDSKDTKTQSWFNDTILTNIDWQYGSGESINWQNTSAADSLKTEYTNVSTVSGYGLNYKYWEIPGYYLQYIEIILRDKNNKRILLDIKPIANALNTNSEYNNFSNANDGNSTPLLKGSILYGMDDYDRFNYYYEIYYYSNSKNGYFEVKLYDTKSTGLCNINSVAITSNNINVNFYSMAYNYNVQLYSNVEGTYNGHGYVGGSSSSGTLEWSSTAQQSDYKYVDFYYDSMKRLNVELNMTGYTFVGWGSNEYWDGSSVKNRYNSSTNTWYSGSAWKNITNHFASANRSQLKNLVSSDRVLNDVTSLYSYDFYVAQGYYDGSTYKNSSYFVTDTGNSSTENYNFWSAYSYIFGENVGYYNLSGFSSAHERAISSGGNGKFIKLYGIWKANTYMIKFNPNDASDSNGSTYSYMKYNGIANPSFIETSLSLNMADKPLGFKYNGTTYYCYIKFDSDNWYVTNSESYLYNGENACDNGNLFKFIVDRYGYSWLGWYGQNLPSIEQNNVTASLINSKVVFGSQYYNKVKIADNAAFVLTKPLLNYSLYNSTFGSKYEINTSNRQKFVYADVNTDVNMLSFYYYGRSTYKGSNQNDMVNDMVGNSYYRGIDYLNSSSLVNEYTIYLNGTNPSNAKSAILAFYDTSLSAEAYSVSEANVLISRTNNVRYLELFARWQINKYNIVFDWQDGSTINSSKSYTYSLNKVGSSEVAESIKVNEDNKSFYFDDSSLASYLNELNPVREGYDFIGWSFYYVPSTTVAAVKEKYITTDKYNDIIYNDSSSVMTNYYLNKTLLDCYIELAGNNVNTSILYTFSSSATINRIKAYTTENGSSSGLWALSGSYNVNNGNVSASNTYAEKLGDDSNEARRDVYIFAIWQAQTFTFNISLNIEAEDLENMYEKDSNFTIGFYKSVVGEGEYDDYTAINSSYYKFNSATFTDIVANLNFEIEFDKPFTEAKCNLAPNSNDNNYIFYAKDFFATSTGYYFLGLMKNSAYTNSTSYLLVNNLATEFGVSGVKNGNVAGSSHLNYSTDTNGDGSINDEDVIFNLSMYRQLMNSNYKPFTTTYLNTSNYQTNTSENPTYSYNDSSTFLNNNYRNLALYSNNGGIDAPNHSTNFGYVTIGGTNYYIACEDYIDGTIKHRLYFKYAGVKYYVLFYNYLSSDSYDTIQSDHTFLYIDNHQIRFDTQGNAYYVASERGVMYSGRVTLNLRMIVTPFTANLKYETTGNILNTQSFSYSSGGAITFTTYNAGVVSATLTACTTRQFTLYAHWQNKQLELSLINANIQKSKLSNVQSSNANYGLAGYYVVSNITSSQTKIDRGNSGYNNNFAAYNDFATADYISTSAGGQYDYSRSLVYNYYDSLNFTVLPFFNGRYLSSLTLTFNQVVEKPVEITDIATSTTYSRLSTYANTTNSIKFKFEWDNKDKTIRLTTITFFKDGNEINIKFIDESKTDDLGDLANTTSVKMTYNSSDYYQQMIRLAITTASELSLIDKYSLNDLAFKIYDYNAIPDGSSFRNDTMDINAVTFDLDNVMSSIMLSCEFSVQTYQINFYSVIYESEDGLESLEGSQEFFVTPFKGEDEQKAIESFQDNTNYSENRKYSAMLGNYQASNYLTEQPLFATIKQDCANTASTTYNVPYGYYLFGYTHSINDKGYRPIDTVEVRELLDKELYGFYYLYVAGNYQYGTTTNKIKGVLTDDFVAQESPVLGPVTMGASENIRLTNLSFYTFGGWYEYYVQQIDDTYRVIFDLYNGADEETYLNRNIDLYGYYYAINKPTSITFYYWEDLEYKEYSINKDKYTLKSYSKNSSYIESFNCLSKNSEATTNLVDNSGFVMVNHYKDFGANQEKFNGINYTNNDFNPNSDTSILTKLLRNYWFRYETYDTLIYNYDGSNYYIMPDGEDGVNISLFKLVDENKNVVKVNNLGEIKADGAILMQGFYITTNSEKTSFNINMFSNFGIGTEANPVKLELSVDTRVKYDEYSYEYGGRTDNKIELEYNLVGADLYLSRLITVGEDNERVYYKLHEITEENRSAIINEAVSQANAVSEEGIRTWFETHNPRYYVDIMQTGGSNIAVRCYLITASSNDLASTLFSLQQNGSVYSIVENLNIKSYTTIEAIDNYYIDYNGSLYPVIYYTASDSVGLTYYNPYKRTKENRTVVDSICSNIVPVRMTDGSISIMYFDFGTKKLYISSDFSKEADMTIYMPYTPVNDNFTLNAVYNNTYSDWTIASITINKLPSPNMTPWYNDVRYGFVGYIKLDDEIINSITSSTVNKNGEVVQAGHIVDAFTNYINIIYADESEEYRQALTSQLKGLVSGYAGRGELYKSLLSAASYMYDSSNTRILQIRVNIPIKFAFSNPDDPENEDNKITISLVVSYDFDIISELTVIENDIYAVPIYAPIVIEFNDNSVDVVSDTLIQINVNDMSVCYIEEVSSTSVRRYTREFGDYLHILTLNEAQYQELQRIIVEETDRDYAAALDKLVYQELYYSNSSEILSNISFEGQSDGNYYIIAYYEAANITISGMSYIRESLNYVARISDNMIILTIEDGEIVEPIAIEPIL